MTNHYHGIDAEESILTKSLPNLGTWAAGCSLIYYEIDIPNASVCFFRYTNKHSVSFFIIWASLSETTKLITFLPGTR